MRLLSIESLSDISWESAGNQLGIAHSAAGGARRSARGSPARPRSAPVGPEALARPARRDRCAARIRSEREGDLPKKSTQGARHYEHARTLELLGANTRGFAAPESIICELCQRVSARIGKEISGTGERRAVQPTRPARPVAAASAATPEQRSDANQDWQASPPRECLIVF